MSDIMATESKSSEDDKEEEEAVMSITALLEKNSWLITSINW